MDPSKIESQRKRGMLIGAVALGLFALLAVAALFFLFGRVVD